MVPYSVLDLSPVPAGKTPADAIELIGYGHATGPITGPDDLTEMEITKIAGQQAMVTTAKKSLAGFRVRELELGGPSPTRHVAPHRVILVYRD